MNQLAWCLLLIDTMAAFGLKWLVTFEPYLAIQSPRTEHHISVTVLQFNTTDESERQALHGHLTTQTRLDDESTSDTILLRHTIDSIELDFSFFDLPEVVDYMDGRIINSIRASDCYINSLRGIPDSTVGLYVRHCRVTSLQHVPSKVHVLNLFGNPIERLDEIILEHPHSIDLNGWNGSSYRALDRIIGGNTLVHLNLLTARMITNWHLQVSNDRERTILDVPTDLGALFKLLARLTNRGSSVSTPDVRTYIIPSFACMLAHTITCRFGDRVTRIPVAVLHEAVTEVCGAGRAGILKARRLLETYDSLEGIW